MNSKRIIYFLIIISYMTLTNAMAKNIPDTFVELSVHIPTINLDIRYFTTNNFVGARIDGYKSFFIEKLLGLIGRPLE